MLVYRSTLVMKLFEIDDYVALSDDSDGDDNFVFSVSILPGEKKKENKKERDKERERERER